MSEGYTVTLDRVFHGPMDLLLHLVKEQEVEIHEIQISRVIEGYLEHLKRMSELDLEVAGDFLVMAATLMAIKSRSLLPRDEVDLEDDLDPQDELIARLVEYRRFREASDRLARLWEERANRFGRGGADPAGLDRDAPVLDLGDLTSWDLLAAFSRLMRETGAGATHHVSADPRPLRYWVDEIARRIQASRELPLRAIVDDIRGPAPREAVVGSFCALLELVKLGLVTLQVDESPPGIVVRLRPEHADDLESVLAASLFDDELEEELAAGVDGSGSAGHIARPPDPPSEAPDTPPAPTEAS